MKLSRITSLAILSIALLVGPVSAYAFDPFGILPPGDHPVGPYTGFTKPEFENGEVVVEFQRAGLKAARQKLRKRLRRKPTQHQVRIQLARMLGLRTSVTIYGNTFVVRGNGVTNVKISRLAKKGYLKTIDPNYKMFAFAEPNDFLYTLGFLWGINNAGGGFFGGVKDVDVDALEAWEITKGDPSVVVAVIDSGTQLNHPDLAPNLWVNQREIPNNGIDDDRNGYVDDVNGYDFIEEDGKPDDRMFHGTHCAGIIAAAANNNRGIAGVAPGVKLMTLRVLDEKGQGDVAGVMRAIQYAIDQRKAGVNIRVISASLGGPETVDGIEELIEEAGRNGILYVGAAGNDGNNNDTTPTYPASLNSTNIISVAAVDNTGKLASFSNYGIRSVDVAAPGVAIWSAFLFGFYLPFDGTSMAAPFVSGTAALLFSEQPDLTPQEAVRIIKSTVKPIPGLSGKMGAPGIVSARAALEAL